MEHGLGLAGEGWPAIQWIKAQMEAGALPGAREFERVLPEEFGLCQREAKALLADGYNGFAERRDPENVNGELLDTIRRAAAVLH